MASVDCRGHALGRCHLFPGLANGVVEEKLVVDAGKTRVEIPGSRTGERLKSQAV